MKKKPTTKCKVCGKEINKEGSPYINGKGTMRYYFCSEECMAEFKQEPKEDKTTKAINLINEIFGFTRESNTPKELLDQLLEEGYTTDEILEAVTNRKEVFSNGVSKKNNTRGKYGYLYACITNYIYQEIKHPIILKEGLEEALEGINKLIFRTDAYESKKLLLELTEDEGYSVKDITTVVSDNFDLLRSCLRRKNFRKVEDKIKYIKTVLKDKLSKLPIAVEDVKKESVAPIEEETSTPKLKEACKIVDKILGTSNSILGKKLVLDLAGEGYSFDIIIETLENNAEYLKSCFKKKKIKIESRKVNYSKSALLSILSKPKEEKVSKTQEVSDDNNEIISILNGLLKIDKHTKTDFIVKDLVTNYSKDEVLKATEHEKDNLIAKRNILREKSKGDTEILYAFRTIIEDRINKVRRILKEQPTEEILPNGMKVGVVYTTEENDGLD